MKEVMQESPLQKGQFFARAGHNSDWRDFQIFMHFGEFLYKKLNFILSNKFPILGIDIILPMCYTIIREREQPTPIERIPTMNTTVINRLLKTIETTADAKGWDVDSNRHYVAVTSIVVDVDDFGKVPTYEEKVYVRDVLVALCMTLDLNYEALLRQYVTEAEQSQWHYVGRVDVYPVGFDEYTNTDETLGKRVWDDGYEEIFERA